MDEKTVSITIESNLDQVRLVGQKVKDICDSLEFSNVNAGEIELALVESVTNCIKHAYQFQTGNKIDVDMSVNQTQVDLHIRDYGMPMEEHLSEILNSSPDEEEIHMPDHEVETDLLPTSGWGISLVRTLCDSIEYSRVDGCNRLSLSFHLSS